MRQILLITAILAGILLAQSCANKISVDPNSPRATVYLRSGESFTGAVTNSSPTEITLASEDNNRRTFDMKNVRSVEYSDAMAAAREPATPATLTPAQPAAPQRVAPAPVREAPPPAASPDARPVAPAPPPREHPDESRIETKTYRLPVGTEVA